MRKILSITLILFLNSLIIASDHGMYLKVVSNINSNVDAVGSKVKSLFENSEFTILNYIDVSVPDIVRENDKCGSKAKLLILTSKPYIKTLTKYGNKYLTASFLRVGIYETPEGVNITIADPETINRIIFNDLFENDKEKEYKKIVEETKVYKSSLIKKLHTLGLGSKVSEAMPPVRSDEDLMESSRDMFMMVGPMTFFNDEDQFPIVYKIKNTMGKGGVSYLKEKIEKNLKKFKPLQEDIDYRPTISPEVLKWKIVSEVYSPDSTAILLGLTRPRTEGLSFHIAGASRENEKNKCPGIDHVTAYPIEVLIMQKDDNLIIQTCRQMFRMDMYFWDAGMPAFMDHMSMPGILDVSLRKAILGNDYSE